MRIKSLLITAVIITAILGCASFASAQTADNSTLIAQLKTQIQALMQQLATIQGQQTATTTPAWCHTFNNYLVAGSTDATTNGEISFLQTALTKSGFDVIQDGAGTFGEATAAAVVQFQGKNQIMQTGTVGPKTRAQLNSLYGCAPGQTPTQPTIVTPQVQTPATTTPVGSTLCNGTYYSQCPSESSLVCPASGSAYCQPSQNQVQNPLQPQPQPPNNLQNSPYQNGATPPPDCVGKTATTPNLPQDCQIYFGLTPQPTQSQPPASCNGHVPTDANLPADCAAWNAAHPMPTPMPGQSSLSPNCGGPGQVWCPSPAGTGGWCQLPPCPSVTTQSGSSRSQSNMSGSPYQNGATPPPDCVGKTATTPNLPQDCQIYFGLTPQPTSMNSSTVVPASILDAFNKLLQSFKSFVGQ